ncbi:RdRP-domain-containing protein [Pseudovirgaria hyperparasitica]|uniref:RNA-directed RNA polymerase n=1 Tax=Pseudovirgaria hyperparasitica TaxID=470096 RepID=A0A6A6W343_9PEZI|nr:RdRP-domain-containing protein [Pseudovirgaria hyperparasitica]KAF2757358.1 RdRP-domain-containing protein [Pseudovirgaria hyperparasitica]
MSYTQSPSVMSWLLDSEPQIAVDRAQAFNTAPSARDSPQQCAVAGLSSLSPPSKPAIASRERDTSIVQSLNDRRVRSPEAQREAVRQSDWARHNGGIRAPRYEWQQNEEVKVRVTNVPQPAVPKTIYRMFHAYGHISRIEVESSPRTAIVTFCPPPNRPFWNEKKRILPGHSLGIDLMRTNSRTQPSPIDPNQRYPEKMTLSAKSVEFGFMFDERSMMVMRTVKPGQKSKITFKLDLYLKFVEVSFSLTMTYTETEDQIKNPSSQQTDFKFRIPLFQLEQIYEERCDSDDRALRIHLESPPKYFRRNPNVEESFAEGDGRRWSDWQTWIRQTHIEHDKERREMMRSPTTLHRNSSIIDTGRWTTYRLVFERSANDLVNYKPILRALTDYNVRIIPNPDGILHPRQESKFWSLLEEAESASNLQLTALEHLGSDLAPLDFSVRYQLEVCISKGKLCDHNIDRDFLVQISGLPKATAKALLVKVADANSRFYNPMSIFSLPVPRKSAPKLASHYVFMHNAIITPTTMYIGTPTQEISNRVVRQYSEFSDRFLRVKFMDEIPEGKLQSTDDSKITAILNRVKLTMTNGIDIGGRHYEFLAFGNSQFRENGAYFFSPPNDQVYPDKMREHMGDFEDIKVVAKYCARIGQCFSTTRAMNCGTIEVSTAEDIQRNGYTFSDGVGKISRYLLMAVATDWGVPLDCDGDPPSLVQFRLGGCKGVLVLAHGLKTKEIVIRRSQYKFPANHSGLEIIRVSDYVTAQLNRQVIMVLSNLGVPDSVFVNKMKTELEKLDEAMIEESTALDQLEHFIDFNHMTTTLASIIRDGFMQYKDPFTLSVLQLWRTWRLKNLKEKAQIKVTKSAFLFGCVDETGELQGHYEDQQSNDLNTTRNDRLASLPEIFLQIKHENSYKVIEGVCVLARNPSLHPGDIRIVVARDKAALHHLKNVVVLPQTGDRDIANMCSGGDLDGDDYMIIWDEELIPQEINHPPMDFTAPKGIEKNKVTIDDMSSFFVNYIRNDQLGTIATAHLAQADRLEDGIRSKTCLKLAELHSCAVDFPKSGIPARMNRELRPPSKPHFMRPKFGNKSVYTSKKILGQLYDQVQREDFHPFYDEPFDKRVLEAYSLTESILKDAADIKNGYDKAIRRLMAQYAIATEFEVWSTFVLSHNAGKDYQFHEEIGSSISALRQHYAERCIEKAGGKSFEQLGVFVAAMYTVTAREVEMALAERKANAVSDPTDLSDEKTSDIRMPLMSFPWIFYKEMGLIATAGQHRIQASVTAHQGARRRHPHNKMQATPTIISDDLETAQGITHRGDKLELFEDAERVGQSMDIDQFTQKNAGIINAVKNRVHSFRVAQGHSKSSVAPERDHWEPQEDVEAALQASYKNEVDNEVFMQQREYAFPSVYSTTPTSNVLANTSRTPSAFDDLVDLMDNFSIGLDKAPMAAESDTPDEKLTSSSIETVAGKEGEKEMNNVIINRPEDPAAEEEVTIEFDEKPSALTWFANQGGGSSVMESDDE